MSPEEQAVRQRVAGEIERIAQRIIDDPKTPPALATTTSVLLGIAAAVALRGAR